MSPQVGEAAPEPPSVISSVVERSLHALRLVEMTKKGNVEMTKGVSSRAKSRDLPVISTNVERSHRLLVTAQPPASQHGKVLSKKESDQGRAI